jgi:hypothetical protein
MGMSVIVVSWMLLVLVSVAPKGGALLLGWLSSRPCSMEGIGNCAANLLST